MNSTSTVKWIAIASAAILIKNLVDATEPMRIWVDQSGRYSIEARLVEVNQDSIVLLRQSGGSVVLSRDQVSDRDANYLAEVEQSLASEPNLLRSEPPKLPEIASLPILDLPGSEFRAEENSKLILNRASVAPRLQLPQAIEPDASPIRISFVDKRFRLGRIDNHDVVSRAQPVPASTTYVSDDDMPSLAMSISSGLRLPGQLPHGRIVKFDADSEQPTIMWQSAETIRMFDHHMPSGRTLVLIGHSPVGHGGQLAIASGWENQAGEQSNRLEISHRRSLPVPENLGRLQIVQWARWIDDEHICVLLDRSIIMWNLVSGEQLFRMDGVNEKSQPALSAGRRYLAIPNTGIVDLFRTTDGEPLGRIAVEANSMPTISFAPRGDALAIATSRRLRVWDLAAAALRSDIQTRVSLGKEQPLWISDDLIMSGSGVLLSQFRGVPIWQYEMTGATTQSIGSQVAVMRKIPTAELSVVSVPHTAALDAIKWIDTSPRAADTEQWRIPGRSVWNDGQWADRDVRLSSLETIYK